ncbi:hypothetical protein SAMN02927937_01237 [Paenimyroides aquimaris]|uniref:Uncharacterized protein n=1 Tax=Paenimyroides marinum TaxID=1159016 RepID=A0A1H6KJ18_9FLAO|nr:hypothetical protein [Paenimyroides aquimaris]SEH75391.1 hypothetical protein SAMN02927937_01237 [Paenimyroides aquimaris]
MLKYLFILMFPVALFAQNKIEDTTTLDEVVITTHKKKKIKKLKISGTPAYNSFSQGEFIVTSVNEIPKGKISSVTFYFNTSFIDLVDFVSGKKFDTNYLDVKLGLLVYEMNENRELGNIISNCEITFVVPHNHKGAFKIDLSTIDFPKDKFFIGFKVLSQTNKEEYNIYVRLFEKNNHISYSEMIIKDLTNPEKETKILTPYFANLKMTLEIEQ